MKICKSQDTLVKLSDTIPNGNADCVSSCRDSTIPINACDILTTIFSFLALGVSSSFSSPKINEEIRNTFPLLN